MRVGRRLRDSGCAGGGVARSLGPGTSGTDNGRTRHFPARQRLARSRDDLSRLRGTRRKRNARSGSTRSRRTGRRRLRRSRNRGRGLGRGRDGWRCWRDGLLRDRRRPKNRPGRQGRCGRRHGAAGRRRRNGSGRFRPGRGRGRRRWRGRSGGSGRRGARSNRRLHHCRASLLGSRSRRRRRVVDHRPGGNRNRRRVVGQRRRDRARSAQPGQRRADGQGANWAGRGLSNRRFLFARLAGLILLNRRLGRRAGRFRPSLGDRRSLCFFSRRARHGRRTAGLSLLGGFGPGPLRFGCPRGAHTDRKHADSQLLGDVLVNRTGVGLLVGVAHLVEEIEQDSGLHLEISCQFVDAFLHNCGRLQPRREAADHEPSLPTSVRHTLRSDCIPVRIVRQQDPRLPWYQIPRHQALHRL